MGKTLALLLGIVLLAVGVWGWLTGGHEHTLIVFGINMKHNLVHIVSGAAALLAVKGGEQYVRMYLLLFGAVYGVVALAGFLNIAPVVSMLFLNTADNFLHLAIAVACLGVGLQTKAA